MNAGSLMSRFLDEEADDSARSVIAAVFASRTSGVEYLAFNVFNVRLDFDSGIATVEDELDPLAEESLPLSAFCSELFDIPTSES
jgi:hypothetical protein